MLRPAAARQAFKALSHVSRPAAWTAASQSAVTHPSRSISSTAPRAKNDDDEKIKNDPLLTATTKAPEGTLGETEGRFARTDESLQIEYPDDENMPRSPVVQGRGGMHFKRTLAQFSLENKVTLVTGGARGLGLVMSQALVASGSDLAIVDLNSAYIRRARGCFVLIGVL